ncbi:Thiol-disulfide oxidoreductase ResA [Novipirellula aureliae]|uniref:Thiol-disulfide oxidoreductase ResA n=2 Tax=Novipirellula aureliae TaxID=2527966 RepID=A0A5C6DIU3_9BACT|nr:Thiol-disulfide oxidoreductase ResA [Novipirellula aureliae]
MGTATLPTANAVSVGIHALNTSGTTVKVTFHELKQQMEYVPVEAESSVGIELKTPASIASVAKRPDPEFIKLVNRIRELEQRSKTIDSTTPDERQKLMDDTRGLLSDADDPLKVRLVLAFASDLSRQFEQLGEYDNAIVVYDLAIETLQSVEDEMVKRMTTSLLKYRDRLQSKFNMIGKPIELDGETLSGVDFSWQDYQGKIVLVDFWASWCGPCRSEIPNVLKQYERFHEQGFEVVGICLDSNRQVAEDYVKTEGLPWLSLFQDEAGWKHPMAIRYEVHSIPTAILVDRDGNVVSVSARGDELSKLLEARFAVQENNQH